MDQMRPIVISVTTTIPTREGVVWWACEANVPEAYTEDEALDWINSTLIEDRTMRLTRLELDKGGGGDTRYVRKRQPVILGINAVGMITLMHLKLIEGGNGRAVS